MQYSSPLCNKTPLLDLGCNFATFMISKIPDVNYAAVFHTSYAHVSWPYVAAELAAEA